MSSAFSRVEITFSELAHVLQASRNCKCWEMIVLFFRVTFFSLTPHRIGGGVGNHVYNSASVASYTGVIHCRIIGEILENFLSFCWCAVTGICLVCKTECRLPRLRVTHVTLCVINHSLQEKVTVHLTHQIYGLSNKTTHGTFRKDRHWCREEEENPFLICKCPALAAVRHSNFGATTIEPKEVTEAPLETVLNTFATSCATGGTCWSSAVDLVILCV
ncbi:hypothetical protein NQ318_018446 [Aromia moschata]|uniref:Uncharacterized protein n=1 Tax=Aromia moschata TaxID=1265417 RepID=A0AAV8X4D4_9CUCU|nr:hypothetical protein NQ318_018446 [Aromia moschata]